MNREDPYRIKVVVIGDAGVGKSTFCECYAHPDVVQDSNAEYIPTIGIDYFVRLVTLHNKQVIMSLWDMSGHPEFYDTRSDLFKNADIVITLYDISMRPSFDSVPEWLEEARNNCANQRRSPLLVVVGNKADLKRRTISYEQANTYIKRHDSNILYFEVTSTTTPEHNNNINSNNNIYTVESIFNTVTSRVLALGE